MTYQNDDEGDFVHISQILTKDALENLMGKLVLLGGLETTESYFEKLSILKKFYEFIKPDIDADPRRIVLNSFIDWEKIFTPIEFDAWCSIKSKGIPFYPQYPVLNYFCDFANPHKKIIIELDGKDFHSREKDIKRDTELKKLGWTVYRITGAEMYKSSIDLGDYETEDLESFEVRQQIVEWITNTGDGVIEAIRQVYFRNNTEGEFNEWFLDICGRSLETHKYL